MLTPYQFASNQPIWAIDLDGLERFISIYNDKGQVIQTLDAYDIEEGAHGDLGYGTLSLHPAQNGWHTVTYEENGKSRYISSTLSNPTKYAQGRMSKIRQQVEDDNSVVYNMFEERVENALAGNQRITAAERYVFRHDPVKTRKIQDIPGRAERMAGDIDVIAGGIHNGVTDAIRHTLWNAMMTLETDAEFAGKVATAHEQDRPNQPLGEKLMDLHNNSMGRNLASGGGNIQSIYNQIIDQAASGGLLIYDPVTQQNSRSSLSSQQVQQLKSLNVSDY